LWNEWQPEPASATGRVIPRGHGQAGGSHRQGADKLDALVKEIRQRTATKLHQLPGPKR
jgi:hypothetical protein